MSEQNNLPEIIAKYNELCGIPSDINELLPYLHTVAKSCDHITEFGVRHPTSTYAFLAANPKKLISYDIFRDPDIDEVEKLAPDNFQFILGSTLDIEIEETDFLFIDTFHSAEQCKRELALHAHKARKYIGFHDVQTFGEKSELPYEGIAPELVTTKGLMHAIVPFLASHSEWKGGFRTNINNGLLILRRVR
jgi:hypothetical protein